MRKNWSEAKLTPRMQGVYNSLKEKNGEWATAEEINTAMQQINGLMIRGLIEIDDSEFIKRWDKSRIQIPDARKLVRFRLIE